MPSTHQAPAAGPSDAGQAEPGPPLPAGGPLAEAAAAAQPQPAWPAGAGSRARASRLAQGLPEHVEDPEALAQLARWLA